jgi:predicted ATPase/DNA-binding XRE family transcriptional regulator
VKEVVMEIETSFGRWLQRRRKALDLTQQELGQRVGCAAETLRKIEADARRPSRQIAERLAEVLEIPEPDRAAFLKAARAELAVDRLNSPTQDIPQATIFSAKSISLSSKPSTNLPAPLTTFIGREKEQSDVIRLITKHRLVTLTGSGGVGKTRLSIRVGERVLGNYTDGVWLMELASLSNPALIAQAFATLFGLTTQSTISFTDLLINFLRAKSSLLIVDNCEHLLDACAHLIDTLLKNCPHLKILATSREPLSIMGEAIYLVPSLELPDLQQLIDAFRDFETVRLFEERAQLTQFDFSLTPENALSVAQICHHLDGIPLAIELVAAKVGILSTEQIARQLDENFNLLTGGSRTALPRHQTLRASMNWSWGLLTESEQRLMRHLSVFAGGWTLEAAQVICEVDVMELTNSLVKKSLIVKNQETRGGTRYRFHETIRQFEHEKLAEANEEQEIRSRHLNYFLKLSEQIEAGLMGPQQAKWLTRTHEERDNLRDAMGYALETNVEAGMYISSRLRRFWFDFDNREGSRWLAAFLRKPESKSFPHARAKALFTQSDFLSSFQQFSEARTAVEESLELSRAIGDQHGEVDSLISLGIILTLGSSADPVKAGIVLQQALALARTLGDIGRQADALQVLGWDHRDYKRALAYWREAITLYRQVENWVDVADTLSELGHFLVLDGEIDAAEKCLDEANLLLQQLNIKGRTHLFSAYGQIALRRGDFEQARNYFQEEARICNELGNRMNYLWAIAKLGLAELHAANIHRARQIFAETAQNFQKDGSRIGVVFTVEGMSSLCVTIDRAEVAAQLIGWADTTRQEISDPRPKLEQADMDKVIATCVAKMGETAFSDTYEAGKNMSLDEALDLALKTVEEM